VLATFAAILMAGSIVLTLSRGGVISLAGEPLFLVLVLDVGPRRHALPPQAPSLLWDLGYECSPIGEQHAGGN
jgi:hypothetical protein